MPRNPIGLKTFNVYLDGQFMYSTMAYDGRKLMRQITKRWFGRGVVAVVPA